MRVDPYSMPLESIGLCAAVSNGKLGHQRRSARVKIKTILSPTDAGTLRGKLDATTQRDPLGAHTVEVPLL